jgi:hypothetical protein
MINEGFAELPIVPGNGASSTPRKKSYRWKLGLTLTSPILLIGACSVYLLHIRSVYFPRVAAASVHLHELIERGDSAEIYSTADAAFQRSFPGDSAAKFLARIRRKLGNCQYSEPTSWSVNSTPAGTFVVVSYQEQCTYGDGKETLTWRVRPNSVSLVGMVVDSPALLTD